MRFIPLTANRWRLSMATGTALLILNLFFVHHPWLGVPAFVLYGVSLARLCGTRFNSFSSTLEQTLWGRLVGLMLIILLSTFFYYLAGTTTFTVALSIIILPLFFFKKKSPTPSSSTTPETKAAPTFKHWLIPLLIILLDGSLIAVLFSNATTGFLPSPWQTLTPWFFLLYGLTTGALFYWTARADRLSHLVALHALHLFVAFGIAAIIYQLGFGFDAFVHRATENWIFTHGFILPKNPYYTGQYSFIVWLAHVTSLPIFYLDVYLVPVLAAAAIPSTIAIALYRVWDIPYRSGFLLSWLIPFIPFFSLHLTTPYNLALLFSLLLTFVALACLHDCLPWQLPALLAVTILAIHPLLGAPMLVFVLAIFLLKKLRLTVRRKKLWLSLLTIFTPMALALLILALFTWQSVRSGGVISSFGNPFAKLPAFLELFARPYWYATHTPWRFELLYAWSRLIVPVILLLALFGFVKKRRDPLFHAYLIWPALGLGCILSAWLLRSWIIFPDVVTYEQGDYPWRLVKASLIFLLPFGMFGVQKLSSITYHLAQKYRLSLIAYRLSPIAISLVLMLSLYLSYPQRNVKARFPGYNVTASDFRAVEWIHNQQSDFRNQTSAEVRSPKSEVNYIVLSNQLVSAAALTNYSFAKYYNTPSGQLFYYSLPTGGLLYQDYGRMLYQGQKREYMEHAMDLAGVNTAYFVVNSYWANSDKIIAGAKTTADRWQVIDDGKVWIFYYRR